MSTRTRRERSRAVELAEAEAERVESEDDESEDDEPEPDAETEQEDAPAADAGGDAPSIEAALAAFDREQERHERELRAIMGDDFAAFQVCAGCNGVGYSAVEGIQYDPDLERCDRCKGHGHMLTGSANDDFAARPCVACQGNGYVAKAPPAPEPQPPAQTWAYDPATGQALIQPHPGNSVAGADGPWAPGYVPPAGPAPGPFPRT